MRTPADDKRHGCFYCFATLFPEDERPDYRTFVYCLSCEGTFHQTCYTLNDTCVKCGAQQVETFVIETIPPLKVQEKKKAIEIRPSSVAYSFDEFGLSDRGVVIPQSASVLFQSASQQIEEAISNILSDQENEYAIQARQNAGILAPILLLFFLLACLCVTAVACGNILFG